MFNKYKIPKIFNQYIFWLWQKKITNLPEKETGNALVTAITIGLLVLGSTSLALYNSSKQKSNAQAEEYTKRAMATAEAGVTRMIDKLSSDYNYYLTLTHDPANSIDQWLNPPSTEFVSPCAPNSSTAELETAILKANLDANGNRRYVVKSYIYDPSSQQGTLSLQGQETNAQVNSQAQIAVAMNIEQLIPPGTFPGLYGKTIINVGNNDIVAETTGEEFNIVCSDCESSLPANCTNGEPSQAYLEDAMGVGSNGDVDGKMVVGVPELPDYPPPPDDQCSVSQAYPCFIVIDHLNADQTFPRPTDVSQRTNWVNTDTSSAWYGDATYLSKPYIYIIKHKTSGQPDSITGGAITIDSSIAPVRWYVAGNIKLAGSGKYLVHTGTLEKFAIFGCTEELNKVMINNSISPTCMSPYTNQEIKLNGQTTAVNVFVYAPNATVGINGGGDFQAVIWANAWDMSNGNNATIIMPDNAETLLSAEFGTAFGEAGMVYNRIGNLAQWIRQEAN
jgi:hypothetical protein